jgi:hypothetical protein
VGPSDELRQRINAIPPGTHLWAAATAAILPKPAETKAEGPFANFTQNLPMLLRSVQALTFHATLSDSVNLEFAAACADDKGAKVVHDSLRGVIGLARFALPDGRKRTVVPILDLLQVEQREKDTYLRANLTVGQFEALHAMLAGDGKKAD